MIPTIKEYADDDEIETFLLSLTDELKFINISVSRISSIECKAFAFCHKEMVGFCGIEISQRINKPLIAINKSYHGQGIGEILLMGVLKRYRKSYLISNIRHDNFASLNLYRKLGFFPICLRGVFIYVYKPLNLFGRISSLPIRCVLIICGKMGI